MCIIFLICCLFYELYLYYELVQTIKLTTQNCNNLELALENKLKNGFLEEKYQKIKTLSILIKCFVKYKLASQ